jgi:hypothetical protein
LAIEGIEVGVLFAGLFARLVDERQDLFFEVLLTMVRVADTQLIETA